MPPAMQDVHTLLELVITSAGYDEGGTIKMKRRHLEGFLLTGLFCLVVLFAELAPAVCLGAGTESVEVGTGSEANGNYSYAYGAYSTASGAESIAIGTSSNVSSSGTSSIAIGKNTTSSGANSVAIGANSSDGGESNVVSVGSALSSDALLPSTN